MFAHGALFFAKLIHMGNFFGGGGGVEGRVEELFEEILDFFNHSILTTHIFWQTLDSDKHIFVKIF